MSTDVVLDANVLSRYLFLWQHWEMISDIELVFVWVF